MMDTQHPPIASETLPSRRTLARATAAVLCVAALLAVGVVLPAETGRDPLGVGSMLGLTEMGQIKVALAQDAATEGLVAGETAATDSPTTNAASAPQGDAWRDSMRVTLEPNQGIELKLVMQKNEKAIFAWSTDSAEVYFNRHGEPPNAPKDYPAHSYAKGMARDDQGEIVAVFDGMHGWFWRNRSSAAVTITLKTRGQYRVLKRL
jgi:hypothetical protein